MPPRKSNIRDKAANVVSGQLEKRIEKQQQRIDRQRGVIFLKHLPHGFFEEQLKHYFEQFGDVTRLRLARSKRTGGSKNYAFVEFEFPEVAQVAAETMDNYLMFNKVVKAEYIPPEKQRFNYFKSTLRKVKNKAGKTIYISAKTASIRRKVKNFNNWTDDVYQKRTLAQMQKAKKLQKKYAHLGIDFSKFVVQPTKLTEAQQAAAKSAKNKPADNTDSKLMPVQGVAAKVPVQTKKPKKKVALEDLLGSTINDDSQDEDFIAMGSEEDNESETSDEGTYGFTKDSQDESAEENSDNDAEEDDEEVEMRNAKVLKANKVAVKSKTNSKVDRFDEMLKRKPRTGGIQKFSKKALQKPIIAKPKNALQMKAAKELTKSLPLVKNKIGKAKLNMAAKAAKKQKS